MGRTTCWICTHPSAFQLYLDQQKPTGKPDRMCSVLLAVVKYNMETADKCFEDIQVGIHRHCMHGVSWPHPNRPCYISGCIYNDVGRCCLFHALRVPNKRAIWNACTKHVPSTCPFAMPTVLSCSCRPINDVKNFTWHVTYQKFTCLPI